MSSGNFLGAKSESDSGKMGPFRQSIVRSTAVQYRQFSTPTAVRDGPRICVVGRELSGLCAAFFLRRLLPRADITLVLAGDRVGARSRVIDGFHLEQGMAGSSL